MNIAIVTGASSGMGREFVLQLGQYVNVDEIWVIARRQAALESLKNESKLPIRPVLLDLLEESSFSQYEQLLSAEKPNVKLLVNAAKTLLPNDLGHNPIMRALGVRDEKIQLPEVAKRLRRLLSLKNNTVVFLPASGRSSC